MHLHASCIFTVGAFALCARADAQHLGDIGLAIADGFIATHTITSGGLSEPARVFAGEFGNTGSPHFTSDPGFDALPGTFQVGTRVGFRFTAPVLVWNGAAFESTDPAGPLAGERVRAAFLTLNATSGEGATTGFDLAVQSNGGWHRHLSWSLLPAPGEPEPDAGVYLVQISMYSTDPAVGESLPLALVLNDGMGAAEWGAAVGAAHALLAGQPCPADLNGNGAVDGADLGAMLAAWGLDGPADLDGDGTVSGADLGALLSAWGPCSD